MRLQHQGHAAIQTNDFEMHLNARQTVLPYYFIFNKMNYARYGSYYVQVLKEIESNYPGLKGLLFPCGYLFKPKRHTQCELQSTNGVSKL